MTAHSPHAHDPPPPGDEQLAQQARAGCLRSFELLVHRFQPRLLRLLGPYVGNDHDAEDLVQEAFVRAYQRLHQYDARWRFSTWLFTIALRLAATHLRRRPPRPASLTHVADLNDGDVGPVEHAAQHEAAQRLWPLARRLLSSEQYAMLWLRYGEAMSVRDIATVTGRSTVAVKVGLHRSRQRLAQALQDGRADTPPRDETWSPPKLDTPGLSH